MEDKISHAGKLYFGGGVSHPESSESKLASGAGTFESYGSLEGQVFSTRVLVSGGNLLDMCQVPKF